jgi:hypothetical protein
LSGLERPVMVAFQGLRHLGVAGAGHYALAIARWLVPSIPVPCDLDGKMVDAIIILILAKREIY